MHCLLIAFVDISYAHLSTLQIYTFYITIMILL